MPPPIYTEHRIMLNVIQTQIHMAQTFDTDVWARATLFTLPMWYGDEKTFFHFQ